MNLRAYQYIFLGQLALGVSMLLCLILIPHYFFSTDQGGVSNYGTEDRTRWIFIVGFGVAALATLFGCLKLPAKTAHITSWRLVLGPLSLLYVILLVSTFSYKLSGSNKQLHELAAAALFLDMLAGALWIRFNGILDTKLRLAFRVFCLGFTIGLLTLAGLIHLLFTAQIICEASFAYMLTYKINTY